MSLKKPGKPAFSQKGKNSFAFFFSTCLTLVREPLKRPLTPTETPVVTEAYGL
ncbi:hypothetical protein [Ochrobactrum teleogrylli]